MGLFKPSASCPLTTHKTQRTCHSPVHSETTSFSWLSQSMIDSLKTHDLQHDWQSSFQWLADGHSIVNLALTAFHLWCASGFCLCCLVTRCSGFVTIFVQEPCGLLCGSYFFFFCYFIHGVSIKLTGKCQKETNLSVFSEDEGWWGCCNMSLEDCDAGSLSASCDSLSPLSGWR